jgi:hypothetical protein
MNGNSGLAYINVGNTPSPSLILEKSITDNKTDYRHIAGIKERIIIKMLPALPCSVLKLSTRTQYILYISTYLIETTRQFTSTGVLKNM